MKKYLLFLVFCSIASTSFSGGYDNCTPFVGVNGKKYCMATIAMTNWYGAVAYCHAQGYKLASANAYCDEGTSPDKRFGRPWAGETCKNMVNHLEGQINRWLLSPVNSSGLMFASRGIFGAIDNVPVVTGNVFGAICDTGECGDGFVKSGNGCESVCAATPPDDLSTVDSQACCERWNLTWDTATSTCGCPNGTKYVNGSCQACYTTNNANASSGNGCSQNSDCCSSDDFCAFLNSDVDNNTQGVGTCIPATSYTLQSIVIDGHVLVRSDGDPVDGMNWWTAQNWCEAKNLDPATRQNIGCGSITSDSTCNSTYTTEWSSNAKWMGSNKDRKLWLDEAIETNPRVGWTVRLSKGVQKTTSGQYHNKIARSDDRFALCIGNASCSSGQYFDDTSFTCKDCGTNPGDPSLTSNQTCCELFGYTWETGICRCPSGTIWDSTEGACVESCYATNNEGAPDSDTIGCTQNSDCCSSDDFCAFITNATTTEHGKGTCVPITTYYKDPDTVFVDNKEWFRTKGSSGQINWWSAQNWCTAQGADPATKSLLGCGDGNCTNTLTTALEEKWTTDKHWLERYSDTAGYAYVVLFRTDNTAGISYSNKASMGTQLNYSASRYALCTKEAQQCGANAVGAACETNSDCCSSDFFCAFLAPESDSEKGTGSCQLLTDYPAESIDTAYGTFIRSSVAAGAGMNWWSAQNWCEARGYDPVRRSVLGCFGEENWCTTSVVDAIRAQGWNTDCNAWIDKFSDTQGMKLRFSNRGIYYSQADISQSDGRYAFCYDSKCGAGEVWNENTCVSCSPSALSDVTVPACCVMLYGTWTNNTCECQSGRVWDDVNKKCSLCQYRYTQPSDFTDEVGNGGNCAYDIVISSDKKSFTATPVSGLTCPLGQYCYAITNETCGFKSLETGRFYGNCMDVSGGSSEQETCVKWMRNKQVTIERVFGCDDGYYCKIRWVDEAGTTLITEESDGVLYGQCQKAN